MNTASVCFLTVSRLGSKVCTFAEYRVKSAGSRTQQKNEQEGVCSHLLCAVEASWVCQGVVSCVQSWRCCESTTLERKTSFHFRIQQMKNHWICTAASTGRKEMAHCWEENIIFYWKKMLLVVNRGGPEGILPRVALSFSSSSLITDWIRSDDWWRGVRGGWGADRTCSQSCPSLQNARKTRDCCVWATAVCEWHKEEEEEGGKVDALGQRRRVAGQGWGWGWRGLEEQQSRSK